MIRNWFFALSFLCLTALPSFAAQPAKYIVAHDATWPPMEFVDKNRNLVGYSIDYIAAVAKAAGFEIEHKNVAWDGIFSGLSAKRYDIIASSVTITDERKKVMDFSDPYYTVRQAVVMPKDTDVTKLEGLRGKSVGAQIGTTGFITLKKDSAIKAMSYDEIGLAMEALATGRIDAAICDDPTAVNFVLANPAYAAKLKVAFTVPAEIPEFYGFAVDKGNKELLDLINKGIRIVRETGKEETLIKKWITN